MKCSSTIWWRLEIGTFNNSSKANVAHNCAIYNAVLFWISSSSSSALLLCAGKNCTVWWCPSAKRRPTLSKHCKSILSAFGLVKNSIHRGRRHFWFNVLNAKLNQKIDICCYCWRKKMFCNLIILDVSLRRTNFVKTYQISKFIIQAHK